jgi:uncharacterized protein GlcG (DUF336 family)
MVYVPSDFADPNQAINDLMFLLELTTVVSPLLNHGEDKAWTAAASFPAPAAGIDNSAAARYRRPTLVFETLMGKGFYFSYPPTLGDAFTGSRGGNPIVVGGKIIGAIGCSGGTGSQDDTISKAGATALK